MKKLLSFAVVALMMCACGNETKNETPMEQNNELTAIETIVPLCVIVMGYPNESPQPKDKWKPENVSYNMFK